MKTQIKLNLPVPIAKRVDQAATVVTMSKELLPGTQPLVDALETSNRILADLHATAEAARQASLQAKSAVRAAAKIQGNDYGNLASHVQTMAEGSAAFMLSAGYGVRAVRKALPSPGAPSDLRAKMGADPGTILVLWKRTLGAKIYEVEYTTDLSGAAGWIRATETCTGGRMLLTGLASGTVYLLRVCALWNGAPSPFTTPVQQMAP